MYLNDGYFDEEGQRPPDYFVQGYLTLTSLAGFDHLSREITEVAKSNPEILDSFAPDPALMAAIGKEPEPASFIFYRNDEVAFDGLSDCGYMGFGLDIAFCEVRGIALITYTGPGLSSVVRKYHCQSADEAVDLLHEDWAAPLVYSDGAANDNEP